MAWLRSLLLLLSVVASGAGAREIYQERSVYRNILVSEDDGLRCMRFGIHDVGGQTCMSLRDPDALVFDYTKMLMGALYLNPAPRRVLVIGLGGGTMPTTLRKIDPRVEIDSVELDPSVIKVATRFFGYAPDKTSPVFMEDGRVFVKRARKQGRQYDLVILDAFDHVYIPEHMLTREYLMEVRSLLTRRGVIAANTFSVSRLYDAESATYAKALGPYYNLKRDNRVILFRNDGLPPMSEIRANADLLEDKLRRFGTGKAWLLPLFDPDVRWPADTRILTDQYSPANLLNTRP